MGDWRVRTHWIVAPDELMAVKVYGRLERVAASIRRDGRWAPDQDGGSISVLRFGFGSPRLVVAVTSQKWGESLDLEQELERAFPSVRTLVSDEEQHLIGSIDLLEPAFTFAWSDDAAVNRALGGPGREAVWFGAARVHRLDTAKTGRWFEDSEAGRLEQRALKALVRTLEGEATIIIGVASNAHGLVALGELAREGGDVLVSVGADAMGLFAPRLAGANNSILIRDGKTLLPETLVFDEIAWRLDRHGPHMLWQPTAQRAGLVRAALRAESPVERRAGALMMRRWDLQRDGSRGIRPIPPCDGEWTAGLPATPEVQRYVDARRGHGAASLHEQSRFREVATRLNQLVSEGADARLRELGCRFAELAHAASRVSYWMVRDGTPAADLPGAADDEPLATIWKGNPGHIADQMKFWAAAAAHALHELDREPARAAVAAFLAFDAAIGVAHASGSWWLPPLGWCEAVAGIGPKADIDPTWAVRAGYDPVRARAALAKYVDAVEAVESAPARALLLLEQALREAEAADAPILALRTRYSLLGCLQQIGDEERLREEVVRFLDDLPSPVSIVYYGATGAFLATATMWAANWLAWDLHGRGEHIRSLDVIVRALVLTGETDWDDNIRDTQVRALLAAGRVDEAYEVVHGVLARAPTCEPFADIAASEAYHAWCRAPSRRARSVL